MSMMIESSVLVVLRDAADEIRARPSALKPSECIGLAVLAGAFGHEGYLVLFANAFAERAGLVSEVRR